MRNIWTGISTPPKEEPSDKLDMLLNPERANNQKEDKKMAMEDLRDGRQSIVTYSEARLLVPCLIVHPSLLFKIGREWNGLRFHEVKLLGLLFRKALIIVQFN